MHLRIDSDSSIHRHSDPYVATVDALADDADLAYLASTPSHW